MSGQFTKANAGSNDTVLEFHEFLTMLVRISFFRANPQYGMRKGKDQANADKFGDEQPLPGCLSEMLTEKVLPNARTDTYAQSLPRRRCRCPRCRPRSARSSSSSLEFYEMVSAGRPFLQLDQWLGALEGKLLISDITIDGYVVRLTEPLARAAFFATAGFTRGGRGLLPDELPVVHRAHRVRQVQRRRVGRRRRRMSDFDMLAYE